jgi:hypothetical protein
MSFSVMRLDQPDSSCDVGARTPAPIDVTVIAFASKVLMAVEKRDALKPPPPPLPCMGVPLLPGSVEFVLALRKSPLEGIGELLLVGSPGDAAIVEGACSRFKEDPAPTSDTTKER